MHESHLMHLLTNSFTGQLARAMIFGTHNVGISRLDTYTDINRKKGVTEHSITPG